MSEKLNDMIKQSLSSIKDMVSCDTIMGTPMHMPQGTTIIPISKVTVGYASGGLDYFSKNLPAEKVTPADKPLGFGGGGGTGLSVTPAGFLVIDPRGDVEYINVNQKGKPDPVDQIADLVERSPDIIGRIKELFEKNTKNEQKPAVKDTDEAF